MSENYHDYLPFEESVKFLASHMKALREYSALTYAILKSLNENGREFNTSSVDEWGIEKILDQVYENVNEIEAIWYQQGADT